jgi:hypothetical protein
MSRVIASQKSSNEVPQNKPAFSDRTSGSQLGQFYRHPALWKPETVPEGVIGCIPAAAKNLSEILPKDVGKTKVLSNKTFDQRRRERLIGAVAKLTGWKLTVRTRAYFGGTTMAPLLERRSSMSARCRSPSPFIRPSNRNGRVPFASAAGVCDCSGLVACALAVVADNAATNAIASLDMRGSPSACGPTCDDTTWLWVNVGKQLGF